MLFWGCILPFASFFLPLPFEASDSPSCFFLGKTELLLVFVVRLIDFTSFLVVSSCLPSFPADVSFLLLRVAPHIVLLALPTYRCWTEEGSVFVFSSITIRSY